MGHHHRKNKSVPSNNLNSSNGESTNNNFDLSSMLGNLNFDNVDLSKIDMNKVKSIMDRIKLPETADKGSPISGNSSLDTRINLINSLKELMPTRRAKTMDNITKFLQISQLLSNNRNFSRK